MRKYFELDEKKKDEILNIENEIQSINHAVTLKISTFNIKFR